MAQIMTNKPCFKSATELMVWQEHNCMNCKKGIFYNAKLQKMPLYKCAIQRDIEAQAAGTKDVSQYAFDSVQGKKCAMFRSKNEEESIQVMDFAKGHSLVEENEPKEEKPASVEPEKKAQPVDPIIAKVAKETGASIEEVQEAEKRVLDKIMHGKLFPGKLPEPIYPFNEHSFKKQVKDEAAQMLETFTWNENMMIAFVPLIIANLALFYVQEVLDYCAANRLSEVKKLGRAVKEIRQRYVDDLKKDLDSKHLARIEEQTRQFKELERRNFMFLWFGCNQQIKRVAPDMDFMDMRTNAYCCIMMIEFLKRHNRMMDKIIAAKMGQSHSIDNPHIAKLAILMDAYFPDGFKVEVTPNIDICLKALANQVYKIEFGVEKMTGYKQNNI